VTPAAPKAATPAKAAPKVPAPKPVRPEVAAALSRRKIPFWAMPVLALLPVWLFIYAEAMTPPKAKLTGPLAEGATLYANCAGCHGETGGGGAGYQLNNGEVRLSFDKIADQIDFVAKGNKAFIGKAYGTGRHIGGQKGAAGAMPTWGIEYGNTTGLTRAQIISVICHERFTLQGLSGDSPGKYLDEYNTWCAPTAPEYLKAEASGK
jgi:mono/diheme cytochrome c family protein